MERPSGDGEGGAKGNRRAVYRFRRETRFAKPPAAIWPFISDTARLWEFNGLAPYRFEERVDREGRVRRFVRGKLGPFPVRWEEDFGEWQENHRVFQVRNYQNGPMRGGGGGGAANSWRKARAVGLSSPACPNPPAS